jgi:hypothetical protein
VVDRREFLLGSGVAGAIFGAGQATAMGVDSSAAERSPTDPLCLDLSLDARSISFENRSGERGAGGQAHRGRKGRPLYIMGPGEKVILADIRGIGTIRHIWATVGELPPAHARALRLEVFYNDLPQPSVSVPFLDFFGLPHGRLSEVYSALISVREGRGLNSYIPIPFNGSLRIEFTNESPDPVALFYQIDYTLEPKRQERPPYLHVSFRRENPTTLKRDFVIAEGFKGPGRFLGCVIGIRTIDDGDWYGEGEVKIYRDGDAEFPTYCGTGLEDYVGSAYGLGRFTDVYAGAPIKVFSNSTQDDGPLPALVGFYRWHLPDPIIFSDDLKVTIQQIGGGVGFGAKDRVLWEQYKQQHTPAGPGWGMPMGEKLPLALIERQDDYSSAAFIYCRTPQPVQKFSTSAASRDIAWLPSEKPDTRAKPFNAAEKANALKLKRYWLK